MKLNGAEILIECLKEHGVDTVFGFPGGAVLNIYDALYRKGEGIKHILTSHEQGAAHAADGYARATGRVGVCIATSGPGATNLVTGIATAYMDSIPMVAITGQVATSLLGKDSFQEVDIVGITMPITKHNYIVKDVTKLAETIRNAFRIAAEGRPGPVLVDICKDVTAAPCEFTPSAPQKLTAPSVLATDENILEVAQLINSSQRPVLMSGGGVGISKATSLLLELCTRSKIPVATTLMGLGTFPGNHELYMGLVGMHGSKTSNLAVSQSDLVISVGARFSDRVISDVRRFAPEAKILHIDLDPAEIGKNISIDYALIGDLSLILGKLLDNIITKPDSDWCKKINEWKLQYPITQKGDGIKPQYVMEQLYNLTGGEALITTEVGQHQLWAAQYYKYSFFRQFISSGGLGTMGYGLGACMGAQLGCPNRKVINIAGDGSFRMNCNELATAVEYNLPIIILIMNNHVLGMVRQWQNLFYDKRYSSTTIDRGTNFAKLAEAYGAIGITIENEDEVIPALTRALASVDTPVVIDCRIDEDQKVFPIVPPGAPIVDVIME